MLRDSLRMCEHGIVLGHPCVYCAAQEPDREKNRSDQFLRGLEGVAAIDNARKGKGEGS